MLDEFEEVDLGKGLAVYIGYRADSYSDGYETSSRIVSASTEARFFPIQISYTYGHLKPLVSLGITYHEDWPISRDRTKNLLERISEDYKDNPKRREEILAERETKFPSKKDLLRIMSNFDIRSITFTEMNANLDHMKEL